MLRIIKLYVIYYCIGFVQCQLSEGSECVLDGRKGRCVELQRCYSLIQVFAVKGKPQICSFKDGKPLVCCTDCELVKDINDIVIDPQRGPLYKDGRGKSWDYCIDQIKTLPYDCRKHYFATLVKSWDEQKQCHDVRFTSVGASGGEDSKRGEFPHMALLGYGDDSGMQWLCGGTLINQRFMLTAGHCTASANLGPVTVAALGILSRSDPEDVWNKYRISAIYPHPEYNSPSKYHDIALLKTAARVKFTEFILPACLPNAKTRDFDYAVAVGWGALGHRKAVADTLQKVILLPFKSEECSELYQPNRNLRRGFNSTTQICWGNKGNIQDTCEGDSGGPLHGSSGCVFDVIGVTSYGSACGFAGQAGIYTRVQHYVPWIESVAWP